MLSHRAGAPANAIETWYAEQFMHLATTLEGIREGDGTLLDNTCLIWLHEQQRGNHDRTDMPYVIAGSCGGFFRGGQCHDFGGIPHNRLLVSLCNAMDIDVDTYGDRSLSAGGALTGLR
jgi:hypothetical protein